MKNPKTILFTGGKYKNQIDFWKEKLSVVEERFVLRSKQAVETTAANRRHALDFALPTATEKIVSALAKDQAIGAFVVLLSAFMYLLARYSRSQLVTIASPLLDGDTLKTLHTNRVYLVQQIDHNATLREWLGHVRQTVRQSYQFQNIPLESIADLRNSASQCGTNVLITFPQIHRAPVDLDQYELVLELDSSTSGKFSFNPQSFSDSFVGGMAQHFQNVLAQYACLDTKLRAVNLLSEAELTQVLSDFNDSVASYDRDKTVQQLFEEQVEQTPENIAVVFEQNTLTYTELNQKSNQLARYLRSTYELKSDDLVGVMMNRSERTIQALLGVLKAGAAFVPIDPEYPKERIEHIAKEASLKLLLLDSECLFQLSEFSGQLFAIDAQAEEFESEDTTNLPIINQATDLAYVMYTSGSTGKPKGVGAIHRAVVRLVKETNYVELNSKEVILQASPITFDASTFEIWGCLLNGGKLVLIGSRAPSLRELEEVIDQHQVSTMWLTADLFHLLVDEKCGALRPVQQLLAGGDVLSANHVKKFLSSEPGRCLINGYGPTESTTFASCHPLTSVSEINGAVSIGRPVAGTQIYLLDQTLQPAPIGVAGELYIGGDGLARGYLNEPQLTAEKFIPNPFSKDDAGSRLYKSGDLALYAGDGTIEFLGRQDLQVKIHGFRIELGEVETVLSRHPGVREAVVIAQGESSEKHLVAYVVPSESSPDVGALRAYLKGKLPQYMLPSIFTLVEKLPLTSNNKVDRNALSLIKPQSEASYCAPQTPMEEILASIYAQVLHLDRIGIDDNFFELGGDSMRAIQVVSRAFEQGMSFNIKDLFEHQTIRELAAHVGIDQSTAATGPASEPFSLISPEDAAKLTAGLEDAYPLTQLQLGMLFHSEYIPESAIYHDVFSLHLQIEFEPVAFGRSIQQLVDSHPVLRTSFDFTNFSGPLQLVHRTSFIPIEIDDLSAESVEQQNHLIEEFIGREKGTHFEWTRPSLLRIQIHKRGELDFQLTMSFHHAILDGWSVASMLMELFQAYEAHLAGRAVHAPAPMLSSFRDFVALEKEALASEETKLYWTTKLSDATVARLPREDSAARSDELPQSGVLEVHLSPELSNDLRNVARLATVPLKSVLLAAHLRVMSLLYGQTDVLTGIVSHGRPETTDGERVLGLFLNTLPFRQRLLPGSWVDLVQQTFQNERELLTHRRLPLAQIQKSLGIGSLFETAFNFVHYHIYRGLQHLNQLQLLTPGGFEMTNFTFVANFSVTPAEEIQLGFSFDSGQLTTDQVTEIADYYQSVLTTMADAPEQKHETECFLSAAEQVRILKQWNDTTVEFAPGQSVARMIEARASENPDGLAVAHGSVWMSYRELNQRANQLAHHLRHLGVGAEVHVGIFMERSAELIVGLLGIMKAGGAYVPLDPSYPEQRLAFMLEQLGDGLVVTQRQWQAHLPAHNAREVLLDCIDEVSESNPDLQVHEENLAYLIYTSGSTGTPKAVAVTHRGFLNLIHWHQKSYGVTAASRATQLAGISFDASVWELWPYLTAGASVYVPDEDTRNSSRKLWEWLRAEQITLAFVPTPLAESLLAEDLSETSSLRKLLTGGDKLRRYPDNGLSFAVVNHYGPTEATVVASSVELSTGRDDETPTIGSPIANTQIYITNENLIPAAVGVSGELLIGGHGLARGYWRRPDLTAERFIPNPFSEVGGERLYRTGDLARFRRDGQIEFLGRIDHQVKIRGYRIELGEVESVLCGYPGVAAAVVMVQDEEQHGGRQLIAYVVAAPDVALDFREVKEYLRSRLPDYMLPAAWVRLETLPLNANGKIDRQALVQAWKTRPARQEFVVPRNAVEQTLADIWSQVLRVGPVGVHDNFFELGGDSILSIQVTARAKKAGIHISPKDIFRSNSLAELALTAGAVRTLMAEQDVVTGSVPLSPIQEWFFENVVADQHHWNQAVLLATRHDLKPNLLETAVNHLVSHHDALRLRFEKTGSGWQQTSVVPEGVLRLVRIDVSTLADSHAVAAIERASASLQKSLNLTDGPLLRLALFSLGPNRGDRALILIHHLAVDGVSWRILLEDLQTVYQYLERGEAMKLLPKTTSFQYWSQKLTLHAQSSELQQELSYWLSEASPEARSKGVNLPIDYPSGENTVASARVVTSTLDADETLALIQEVPAAFHTQINDVLLTALMLAVGSRTLLVDLEGHGREELFEEVDLSRTVGWFTSLYPVYLDLRSTHARAEKLKAVKEQLRRIPNRGIGYGLLRYLCRDDEVRRPLLSLPRAEVSFNYLGQFDQLLDESQLFTVSRESCGPSQSPNGKRSHILEITGSIVGGQLRMNWGYSENLHRAANVETLAQAFMEQLRQIITDCKKSEVASYTPSDFPLASLNQELLDTVIGKLTGNKRESSQ